MSMPKQSHTWTEQDCEGYKGHPCFLLFVVALHIRHPCSRLQFHPSPKKVGKDLCRSQCLQESSLYPLWKDPTGWVEHRSKYISRYVLTVNPSLMLTFSSCSFVFATWKVNNLPASSSSFSSAIWEACWSELHHTICEASSSEIKHMSWSHILVRYLRKLWAELFWVDEALDTYTS